jgi:hypothetical protein
MAEVFKKLGDGKTVEIPVGTGEGLAGIHEELFVSILLAFYESLDSVIEHTNDLQDAITGSGDHAALVAATATTAIPHAEKTIEVAKGLRN